MNSNETCAHCREDANEIIALNSLVTCQNPLPANILEYLDTSIVSASDLRTIWMSGSLDDYLIEAIWDYSPCQSCYEEYVQTEVDFFWWQFHEALKVKQLSQATLDKIVQSLSAALDDLLEQWQLENWTDGVNPVIQELLDQNPDVFLELCSDRRLSPSNRASLRNVIEELTALDEGAEWRAENGLDDTDLLGPLHSALNSLTD